MIVMEMDVEMRVEMVMLKGLDLLVIFLTTKPIALHPILNQSKPIVPTLSPISL